MLAKKVAVVLGIAILLPLAVFYGVNLIDAPPTYFNSFEFDQKKEAAKTPTEKKKIAQEQDRLNKVYEAAEKRHERILFYVAYPVGLVAFLLGGLLTLGTDSIGLMYGGILTLTTGCYFYWDKMEGWLRFGSLILALAIFLAYGYWKRRTEVRRTDTAEIISAP